MKKVFVGLSGGVDSAVSAALLKEQGFDVTGVYMKNWSKAIGTIECPWEEDYKDAKRVAVHLDIPFLMLDFEDQYFEKVVQYMIDAFKSGITPNPDVMCNQEIKFKLFLEACLEKGANMIATGHYANTSDGRLFRAKDELKDQTYFLYRVTEEALKKTIFPLGDLQKTEVRKIAERFKLPNAKRKESMGICFVGKVGIKDFLKMYVDDTVPGAIIDQNGLVVGEHEGALFYTIGQRQGLGVGGGLPYYVTGKNMVKNEVYVTSDIADPKLWSDVLELTSVHVITPNKDLTRIDGQLYLRSRHRAPLIAIKSIESTKKGLRITLNEPIRAVTPGQSAVIYSDREVFGGGIVV
ncbi:tRNA 2-thiouridine(34) synthase MnmA [Candidatus Saccharibacteria bacterium]|nr:tRNA 2-thiouridine(34) synthase MnmA [Candidatus Saccharibacteria bacterium]